MNMTTNTNDNAFPSTFHNGWGEPEKGMTLRDYFAAKAMQALVSTGETDSPIISQASYIIADAMLKAREA